MADKKTPEELETALTEALSSIQKLETKNEELRKEKMKTKTGAELELAEAQEKIGELEAKVAQMDSSYKAEVKKLTAERDKLQTDYNDTASAARKDRTDVTLRAALGKAKIGALNPDDVGDAINHILPMIKYTDKGEAVVSYKDAAGKEVEQSLAEFAEKTYPTTSHAKRFIPADGNRGAGLLQKPGAINGAKAGGNPWVKASFNLTRQTDLIRTNKAEATRLAAEAGVSIE